MALLPTRLETAFNWAASTAILANNEVVMESDTGIVKIGDGIRVYSKLPISDNQQTSALRASTVSDKTGTGSEVFSNGATMTSPFLVTPIFTTTNNITASATQTQAGATPLTTNLNRVVTVVTTGDAVRLPTSYAGRIIRIKNTHATNAIGVFPPVGDAINALGANTVFSLAAGKSCEFFCMGITLWDTLLSA